MVADFFSFGVVGVPREDLVDKGHGLGCELEGDALIVVERGSVGDITP